MKNLEEIKKDLLEGLNDYLENSVKKLEENPSANIPERRNPESLKNRIAHVDELLPIYMASVIRNQLQEIAMSKDADSYKQLQDHGPIYNILTSKDLVDLGYIRTGTRKPGEAEIEILLTKIMQEYGFELPSLDKIAELERQGKFRDALHAKQLRGENPYPSEPYIAGAIPSEYEKEEGLLSLNDLRGIAKRANPEDERDAMDAIKSELTSERDNSGLEQE